MIVFFLFLVLRLWIYFLRTDDDVNEEDEGKTVEEHKDEEGNIVDVGAEGAHAAAWLVSKYCARRGSAWPTMKASITEKKLPLEQGKVFIAKGKEDVPKRKRCG